jgi:hypothetical protein
MNTARKPVQILECRVCGNTYMMSGDAAVRLTQHRPARDGQGICPDCKRKERQA